jgi:hypothetical protein
MKRRHVLWSLAVLNALLLVVLIWKFTPENEARAQAAGRGDYVMFPARVAGYPNGVIYMIDTRDGLLSGFSYDSRAKDLDAMEPINLRRLFEAGAGVGAGKKPPRK